MKYSVILISLFISYSGILKAQWQTDVQLTDDPFSSRMSINNAYCIATNGDFIHVVWFDNRDDNNEIYYKRSIDGGNSWGEEIRLTDDIGFSGEPSVAVDGSMVHVIWYDNRDGNTEIYYKRSTDGGSSWGLDTRLTEDDDISWYSSLAVSDLDVHVVWTELRDGNYEIYYKRSPDGGINWGSDLRLTDADTDSYSPSVSVAGLAVHVVWFDYRDAPAPEIYYKRSIDGGQNWEADVRLTFDPAFSQNPAVSAVGQNIHVVFEDVRTGNGEIFYKRSTDGGNTWEDDNQLTSDEYVSANPTIAASAFDVHVVWAELLSTSVDVFYIRSTDEGQNWTNVIALANGSWSEARPFVALSGEAIHAVWQDTRNSNNEIYYNANPTGIIDAVNNPTLNQNRLQIFPNPAKDALQISASQLPKGKLQLSLFDALGQIVYTENISSDGSRLEKRVDVSALANGLYTLQLKGENVEEVVKLEIR